MDVVHEAANSIDAHLVPIALEQAGLPAFVRGDALLGEWRIAGLWTVVRLCPGLRLAGGRGASRAMLLVADAAQASVERSRPHGAPPT